MGTFTERMLAIVVGVAFSAVRHGIIGMKMLKVLVIGYPMETQMEPMICQCEEID
jgi:hypothetical protein